MKRFLTPGLLSLILLFSACHTVDDERIPYAPVRISFTTQSMWEIYGISGALDYKRFILEDNIPANFPYTSLSYTGFGGVLLCGDIHGIPVAYDLSCPVERTRNVRIIVNEDAANAYCPKCQSVYDVFSNNGAPLSGEAAQKGYGLRRYYVGAGGQGEYREIRNQ